LEQEDYVKSIECQLSEYFLFFCFYWFTEVLFDVVGLVHIRDFLNNARGLFLMQVTKRRFTFMSLSIMNRWCSTLFRTVIRWYVTPECLHFWSDFIFIWVKFWIKENRNTMKFWVKLPSVSYWVILILLAVNRYRIVAQRVQRGRVSQAVVSILLVVWTIDEAIIIMIQIVSNGFSITKPIGCFG